MPEFPRFIVSLQFDYHQPTEVLVCRDDGDSYQIRNIATLTDHTIGTAIDAMKQLIPILNNELFGTNQITHRFTERFEIIHSKPGLNEHFQGVHARKIDMDLILPKAYKALERITGEGRLKLTSQQQSELRFYNGTVASLKTSAANVLRFCYHVWNAESPGFVY